MFWVFQKYVKSIRLRPIVANVDVWGEFQKYVKLIRLRPKVPKISYSTYKSIRNFLVDFFSVKIFEFKIYYS